MATAPEIPVKITADPVLQNLMRAFGIKPPSRMRRLRIWMADALGVVVSFVFAACFCALAILGVIALAKAVI